MAGMWRITMAAGLAGIVVMSAGCLKATSNVTYNCGNVPPSSSILKQIKVGQTSDASVIAMLGKPSRGEVVDGNGMLIYEYGRTKVSHFSMLFLDTDKTEKTDYRYGFEIKNACVADAWKDRQDTVVKSDLKH